MSWFEGVCLTHVILAPGACGYGVWGAVLDTVSGPLAGLAGLAGLPGKFREARSCALARAKR